VLIGDYHNGVRGRGEYVKYLTTKAIRQKKELNSAEDLDQKKRAKKI